ncbi:MAG: MGMT family protein [Chromatiaceae bacterium]|nr:MGMT family protein [Chromatiaceae bacterium]
MARPADLAPFLQGRAADMPADEVAPTALARYQVVQSGLGAAATQAAAADVGGAEHAGILGPDRGRIKRMDESERQLYAWLAQIPPGRVVTYGQLAQLIGRPNGARWVGYRLAHLPAESKLPWHRVLNARGASSLPLDKGGSNRQLRRLQREGVLVVGGRVALGRFQWNPFRL